MHTGRQGGAPCVATIWLRVIRNHAPEDLIPSLLGELKHQKPLRREHRKLIREINARMNDGGLLLAARTFRFDLEELIDALDEYSPTGFYFGAHPGDGACYGWWLSESFTEDFDGMTCRRSGRRSHATTVGAILLVNDHGNTSLYTRAGTTGSRSAGRSSSVDAVHHSCRTCTAMSIMTIRRINSTPPGAVGKLARHD